MTKKEFFQYIGNSAVYSDDLENKFFEYLGSVITKKEYFPLEFFSIENGKINLN